MSEYTVLIDADYIPYKASGVFTYHDLDEKQAFNIIDNEFQRIFDNSKCGYYIAFLSGVNNFRKTIDVEYKVNRVKLKKPDLFKECLQYTRDQYKCYTVHNVEADDIVCSYHQQYKNTILCSPDKDLLQSYGLHYDIKNQKLIKVSKPGRIECSLTDKKKKKVYTDGDFKLWSQMLTGDPTDNIKGVPGKGKVYAFNRLKDCKSETEMKLLVIQDYIDYYGDNYKDELFKNYNTVKMKHDLKIPEISKLRYSVY
jgi:5'-3' exonuclease